MSPACPDLDKYQRIALFHNEIKLPNLRVPIALNETVPFASQKRCGDFLTLATGLLASVHYLVLNQRLKTTAAGRWLDIQEIGNCGRQIGERVAHPNIYRLDGIATE